MWKNTTAALLCGLAGALLTGCGQTAPPEDTPAPADASTGYGADDTGAIVSVSVDESAETSSGRIEEWLTGRVAGLQITRRPDGSFSLRIRGTNSLSGNNEPLLVIDGTTVPPTVVSSALASLSPREVDRVEVLKDAGSTAIYGSRGANGVIVITTRTAR